MLSASRARGGGSGPLGGCGVTAVTHRHKRGRRCSHAAPSMDADAYIEDISVCHKIIICLQMFSDHLKGEAHC